MVKFVPGNSGFLDGLALTPLRSLRFTLPLTKPPYEPALESKHIPVGLVPVGHPDTPPLGIHKARSSLRVRRSPNHILL